MRRLLIGACSLAALGLAVFTAPGCGSDSEDDPGSSGSSGGDGGCTGFTCPQGEGGPPPGCIGLQCQQLPCEGSAKTTVKGTVFDPAGKVPIYNATVYIPNGPLAPITEGAAACDRCDAAVSGKPISITATDTGGNFTLENVPIGEKIPLVIQIGKWRRKVEIANVAKCVETAADVALTRLPRSRAEAGTDGNIPRMALTTGAADPLQCLLRKIGLDDSEFGAPGSDARIHLYTGGGIPGGTPKLASSKFAASLNGGAAFGTATALWGSLANLQKYDVVLLSCEGDENITSKPDPAKAAIYDYAKGGGRIFASHYHYSWFSKSPDPVVKGVATWSPVDPGTGFNERIPPAVPANPATTAVNATISDKFPKAIAMNDWLNKQQALVGGKLPLFDARHNIDAVTANSLSWMTVPNPNVAAPNNVPPQYMTFNTPIGAAEDKVCGRVVVSDIHVAAGSQGGLTDDPQAEFPTGCKTTDLSAQQKALEFMLFDLSSCIQKDDAPIEIPK
jgi:hypothetical protein